MSDFRTTQSSSDISPPTRVPFADQQKIDWLRLIRSENIGPRTFFDLINYFGTASEALAGLPDLAKRGGRAARIRICSTQQAEQEIEQLSLRGGKLLCRGEPDYPLSLRSIDDAPPVVSILGNVQTLCEPQVAFVGARNASLAGVKFAGQLALEVAQMGYVITSGLARGIDTAAHKAALKTGTVAVFAGGLSIVYPPENETLVRAIVDQGGAIVAEMPLNWRPRAQDFPRRNRIVAGLALGLVVVEAARRSGSLISARLANEYGRTVFAVPGSPLDPRSEGTNHLIQQGATLVTKGQDIVDTLRPLQSDQTQAHFSMSDPQFEPFENKTEPENSDRERLLSALDHTPMDIDEVMRFAHLTPSSLTVILLELELAGRIERHPGNKVSLI